MGAPTHFGKISAVTIYNYSFLQTVLKECISEVLWCSPFFWLHELLAKKFISLKAIYIYCITWKAKELSISTIACKQEIQGFLGSLIAPLQERQDGSGCAATPKAAQRHWSCIALAAFLPLPGTGQLCSLLRNIVKVRNQRLPLL